MIAVLTVTAELALAADVTWDGGGSDDNLRTAGNWVGDSAPDTNDVLIFKGTVRTTPNNDFTADTQFNGIIFSNTVAGQAFTLGGNAIDLGGDITAVAAAGTINDTISLPVELVGAERSINLNSNHNLTISGAISGSQVLVKDGVGALSLTSANTHSGGFQLKDGTVKITDSAALGTATVNIQNGGPTLDLGVNALSISNNFFVPNWGGPAKTVSLDLSGSNSGTIAGNIDVRFGLSNGFVTDVGADDTLTLSGTLSTGAGGGAGITKEGDGTLVMTGNNTYAGNTTIREGVVKITTKNALGSTAQGTIVEDGATLELNQGDGGNNEPTTISGSGVGGIGAIYSTGGNSDIHGTITLATNAVIGGTARLDHGGAITDNDNGYTLTKIGNFDFVRGGSMNVAAFVIDQGSYTCTGNSGLPGSSSTVTVNSGSQLTLWSSLTVANEPNIVLNDGKYAANRNIPVSSSINGTMNLNGSVEFQSWAVAHTVNSDISGTGDLTIKSIINNQDSASYTFAGDNTYSNATAIGTGASGVGKMTLKAGSLTGLSSNSAHTVTANSTLALDGFNSTIGSLAGAGLVENGGYQSILEDDFSSGTITKQARAWESYIDAGWLKAANYADVVASAWAIEDGVVRNTNSVAATGYKLSTAAEAPLVQVFSGTASSDKVIRFSFDYSVAAGDKLYAHFWGYTGTVVSASGFVCNIEAGANGGCNNGENDSGSDLDAYNLKDGATSGFGAASTAISGELTGSGTFSTTIDVSELGIAGVQDIGDLDYFLIAFAKDEDGNIGTTSVDNVSIIVDDPTVLTAGVDGSSTTFSGVMQDGTNINAFGFTKDGSGVQTLTGPNTYTGPTKVLDGTLKLGANNVLSDTTELVMDGGTLDADAATDTIGSLNLLSDSTLVLGTAALTFGDSTALTWSGTLTLEGELGDTSLRFIPNITAEQRSHIIYNGSPVGITEDGYITPLGGTVILVK